VQCRSAADEYYHSLTSQSTLDISSQQRRSTSFIFCALFQQFLFLIRLITVLGLEGICGILLLFFTSVALTTLFYRFPRSVFLHSVRIYVSVQQIGLRFLHGYDTSWRQKINAEMSWLDK